ncbi:hypothetical protein ZWY2020_021273 [Hordeum vulgare]|nr:hypothetical protein ZWY2020_021273 [Hordeum vulgare]
MSDKVVWDDARLNKCVEIFKEEVENGNRPLGYFTKKGWNNKYPKDKFKNKWDAIKNDYVFFMELKNEDIGLGWGDAKRTIRCQEKTWKKYNHLKFNWPSPKHLEDLHVIFDKVCVTGASASCAEDISSDESSDDNAAILEKPGDNDTMKLASLKKPKKSKKCKQPSHKNEENEEKSHFLQFYNQTCEKIEIGVEMITSSVQASSTPPATNLVPTILEVMKLVKHCGVKEKTALMHTTLTLIVKPEFS